MIVPYTSVMLWSMDNAFVMQNINMPLSIGMPNHVFISLLLALNFQLNLVYTTSCS